jgi:hypothetical protein
MEKIWVETNIDLIKANDAINENKGYIAYAKNIERNSKLKIGAGLLGVIYLGARAFVGPDVMDGMFNNYGGFVDFISLVDTAMIPFAVSYGMIEGLDYIVNKKDTKQYIKNCEKEVKKALHKYREVLNEIYPSKDRSLKYKI